ncbi:MAG: hypothetical protein H0X04_00505 [Chthoniobacterales bacterium]|nr:hypothetical protein [Chthoniobacterales bacterium]
MEFGLDTLEDVLRRDNEAHNAIREDILSDLAATTTDRQRVQGTSIGGDMMEADEYSRIPTQKDAPGQLLGFPLRKMQYAVGWTREWEKKRTPRDYAVTQQAAQGADIRRTLYEIKKAIFTPTNFTFVDRLVDNASLAVKALMNADSSSISNGPNGETFDGATHTHYNANATLTAAAVSATVTDVVEHGFGGQVRININVANEAAFKALAGFTAYLDPRVSLNMNANQALQRLDITRMDNRAIGIFENAEVWTKPWVPANYLFVSDVGSDQKPLVQRVEEGEGQGLHLEAEIETFPLRAQYQEHKYGFGVWSRLNGAALKFDNAVYAAPTLTW